ncbi:MAG: SpoVA/SpoVAEb family sporulation membrane protein [Clostridiales bacterium]|nr:SpoVA/SpoVAEb family sporulation membrane protein [Clostridiales bacterium]
MEIFLTYLKVFAVGGFVCMLGQVLINTTKMTSARILVTFLMFGVVLEVTGAFDYIEEFAHAGITVPITGFGSNLAKGAIKGVKEEGILGAVKGGMSAVSSGLSAAIFFGFIFALIFKAKTKES